MLKREIGENTNISIERQLETSHRQITNNSNDSARHSIQVNHCISPWKSNIRKISSHKSFYTLHLETYDPTWDSPHMTSEVNTHSALSLKVINPLQSSRYKAIISFPTHCRSEAN
jgi:hypothetical protein